MSADDLYEKMLAAKRDADRAIRLRFQEKWGRFVKCPACGDRIGDARDARLIDQERSVAVPTWIRFCRDCSRGGDPVYTVVAGYSPPEEPVSG